jgi:hypothetical protein
MYNNLLFKKKIEAKIIELVTHQDLEIYVTWPSLENALKGLKDLLDSSLNKEIIHEQTQTVNLTDSIFNIINVSSL